MTAMNWLQGYVDLSNDVVALGVNLGLQTTLVIGGGLFAAWLCRRRGAAVQSSILRVTLVAVLLCPATSWLLNAVGVPGFRVAVPPGRMLVVEVPQPANVSEHQQPAPVSEMSTGTVPTPFDRPLRDPSDAAPFGERFGPGEFLRPMSGPPVGEDADAVAEIAVQTEPEQDGATAATVTQRRPSRLAIVYAWLTGIWLVVAVLLVIRLAVANLLMWRVRRAAGPAPVNLASQCRAVATALNIAAPPILVGSRISSPCVIGWWRPAILLPEKLMSVSGDALAHELAHLLRGDCLWNFISRLSVAVLPMQPLLWVLARRMEEVADEVCDDFVVAHSQDRASYARELVDIAERFQPDWSVATAGVGIVAFKSSLGKRVHRILDTSRELSVKTGVTALVVILACGVVGATFAGLVGASGDATTTASEAQPLEDRNEAGTNDGGPAEAVSADEQLLAAFRVGPSVENLRKLLRSNGDETEIDELGNHHGGIRTGKPEGRKDARVNHDAIMTVRGRVLDPHGKALSNAKLAVVLFSHLPNSDQRPRPPIEIWDEAESDAKGKFAMSYRKPPSDFYEKRASALTVLASHDGFGVSWKYLKFSDDETTADIKLKPQQIRGGRLVNLEGRPVPGAKIHVFAVGLPAPQWQRFDRWPWHHGLPLDEPISTTVPVNSDGSANWEEEVQFHEPPFAVAPWPKSTTTDADGRFAIRGTGRNQRVQFVAYAVEKGGSTALDFDMTKDPDPKEHVFVTNEQRLIEGTVTDSDTGMLVVGAKVRIDATGASLFTAKWPLIADWKGRQNHLSKMYAMPSLPSEFLVPPVFTETDVEGRFRVSAISNPHGQQQFRVTVSSPDDRPYIAFQETINWPRREAFKQEVAIKLRPGVRLRGQVVHEATGQPVARARVDFWSKELPYHFKYRANPMALTPDGDVHPAWRKADFDGRFEVIVPRGRSYLFVNEGTDENEADRIDATEVGMRDGEQPLTPQFTMVMEPLGRSTQPHRYYPDRLVTLDFGKEQRSAELRVTLRKARVLKINVVLPDGKPATDVVFYGGQEPFKEQTDGKLAPIRKTGDAQFEIAHRVDGPISVAFYSPQHSAGAVAELTRDQADEPVTIKLKAVGGATVRFVDADGKSLADYRPLVWMSLPNKPYSGAKDLERLAKKDTDGMWPLQRAFDVIWAAMLDKERHGDLKTDTNGKATLPSLIPGATYRISQFNGEAKDFSLEPGVTVDIGDVVIFEADRTKDLPVTKPAPAEQANVEAAEKSAGGQTAAPAGSRGEDAVKTDGAGQERSSAQDTGPSIKDEASNRDKGNGITNTDNPQGREAAKPRPSKPAPATMPQAGAETMAVRGRVLDSDGQAVPGASVVVVRQKIGSIHFAADEALVARASTNEEGEFAVSCPTVREDSAGLGSQTSPPLYLVFASRPGFGPAWDYIDLRRPRTQEPTLRLVPDQPLEGRIVDLEGKPIAGVAVRVLSIQSPQPDANLDAWQAEAAKNPPKIGEPSAAAAMPRNATKFARFPVGQFVVVRDLPVLATVKTDSTGRFRMNGLGRDRLVTLEFAGAGIATTWVSAVTRSMQPVPFPIDDSRFRHQVCYGGRFDYVAEPGRTVRGVVRDADSKAPLAGVTVDVVQLGGSLLTFRNEFMHTLSDERGRFELNGLPLNGTHTLHVLPTDEQPYFRTEFRVASQQGQQPIQMTAELRRGVWLRGRLIERETRIPVTGWISYYPFLTNSHAERFANFDARLSSMGDDDRYVVGADGSFRIPAIAGRGIIVGAARNAERYDIASGAKEIEELRDAKGGRAVYELMTVEVGNAVRAVEIEQSTSEAAYDLELVPSPRHRVALLDPTGQPLLGVQATGYLVDSFLTRNPILPRAEPRKEGYLDVYGLDRKLPRTLVLLQKERNLGLTTVLDGMMLEVKKLPESLTLQPCGRVTGRLLDGSGAPLRGKLAHLSASKAETVYGFAANGVMASTRQAISPIAWVDSDDAGRFEFASVPPGSKYTIVVDGEEFATPVVNPGKRIELGDLQMK